MPPLPAPSLPDWFLFAHLNLRKSHFPVGTGRIPDTISVSDTAQTPLWWDAVTLQAQHRHEHFMASSASSELLLLFVSTAVQLMRRCTAFRPSPLLLRARWQQRHHTLPQGLVWSQPQGKGRDGTHSMSAIAVVPFRSAQQFTHSFGGCHSKDGLCPAREVACEPKRWREGSSDVDPRAAGNVGTFAVLSEQRVPTNPPRMSAGVQGPQGQGFPCKGSAVINCLNKGGVRASALAACPARRTGSTAPPRPHTPFFTFPKNSKCHQIYLLTVSPCQKICFSTLHEIKAQTKPGYSKGILQGVLPPAKAADTVQEWPVLLGAQHPLPGCQHPEMCCPSPGCAPPHAHGCTRDCSQALCSLPVLELSPSICAQTGH